MKSTKIPFEKMHGLGNDFILVRKEHLTGEDDWGALFVNWCRRKTGIGADGVLILSDEGGASCRLEVVNRDGSVPEICGNGVRCAVVSWATRHRLSKGRVVVHTDAGPRECVLQPDGRVTVDMGSADPMVLPTIDGSASMNLMSIPIPTESGDRLGYAVSIGNPHLIWFDPPQKSVVEEEAARLERHPAFPQRTNVSFAKMTGPSSIALTVWERGCGFTRACGSAACATAAVAVALGKARADTPITVALPGGELEIRVRPDLSRVLMSGPAILVYTGRIDL